MSRLGTSDPSRRQAPRLFGTDGIRGAFGSRPLDEPTVRRLGRALARRLDNGLGKPLVVIGGDTRDSTPTIAGWLAAGLGDSATVSYLGTAPTPAVAFVTRSLGAACGVAISASHNPHPDNGIKLFGGDGFKWPTDREAALEAGLDAEPDSEGAVAAAPEAGGEAVRDYLESLAAAFGPEKRPLDGLAVAIDAGNGAAAPYAEGFFERLGARLTVAHARPDGRNINAGCGSTHPDVIADLTRESGSDLGFSFDGDADRVILADENGEIRDGDAILYLWGRDLDARGALPGRRLVATSMSNLGLEDALGRLGVSIVRCGVGDREVVRTMRREGIVLGGEQSGHIVNLALGTTGDGLMTALSMARLRAREGRPLSELLQGFERYPQLIKNVRVREKVPFDRLPAILAARDRVERELETTGRLVLRYSGTESLARIMIEGRERLQIEALADELAVAITREVGE